MVTWNRVTHDDVLRAIHEYNRLGRSGSSLSMVSPEPRLMTTALADGLVWNMLFN